jgi:hypothetical protein
MARFPAGKWLSVAEAAEKIGVSRRRVQKISAALGAVAWEGRWYLPARAVAAYAASERKRGPKPKGRKGRT